VPGVLAFVFGFFAFRSRIKGVYFSIITQAMTYATMLLFFATRPASAATTASPTSSASSGADRDADHAHAPLCHHRLHADRLLPHRAGDRREQVRARAAGDPRRRSRVMFTGYDPLRYKLAIWTSRR
jgi:urea transport system permease protein